MLTAFARAALLEAITAMSSFQAFTNDFAPSSWSWAAKGSLSTPASANSVNTASQPWQNSKEVTPISWRSSKIAALVRSA
jgi:hypothetical protein